MRSIFPNICRLQRKKENIEHFMYSWRIVKTPQEYRRSPPSFISKYLTFEIQLQYYFYLEKTTFAH